MPSIPLKSTFINFSALIGALVFISLGIPLIFLVWCPLILYRKLVIQYVKFFKKGVYTKILTATSTLLISEDLYSQPLNTLISLLIVKGQVGIEKLRGDFTKKVLELGVAEKNARYPEMMQNVEYFMGFPFWKNLQKFEINQQIHFYNDDENAVTNHEMAKRLLKNLSFQPFSKNQPLWEIIVLPNFIADPNQTAGIVEGEKYTGVIIRSHHGLADGFSQLGLVQSLSSTGAGFSFIKPTNYTKKRDSGSRCLNLLKTISLAFLVPFDFCKMIVRKYVLIESWKELEHTNRRRLKQDLAEMEHLDMPSKNFARFNCQSSPNFSLDQINEIKQIHGVSGTAVLYSAVAAAARNTIFSNLSKIPERVVIVFPLPLPGSKGKLRNHFTMGSVAGPLASKDPAQRVRKIDKRLKILKQSTLPISFAMLLKMGGSLPKCFTNLGWNMANNDNIITISNVAAPKEQIDFAGFDIVDFFVSSGAAVKSRAISISLLSINRRIRVAVGADLAIFPTEDTADEFIDAFFQELNALKSTNTLEV